MNRCGAASMRSRRPASAVQVAAISADCQIAAFTSSGLSMLSRLLCGIDPSRARATRSLSFDLTMTPSGVTGAGHDLSQRARRVRG